MPPLIRWSQGYSVYGINNDPNDILKRIVNSGGQDDGDKYLLEVAHAGDINLIAWVPNSTLPVPEQMPDRRLRVRLAEIDRDCALTWHRASERTILMWPHPDEEKLGRSWCELLAQGRKAGGTYMEAATPENMNAALKQLKPRPGQTEEETRKQLLNDLEAYQKQEAARHLSALVLKYLEGKPEQVREGTTLPWRDLAPEVRAGVQKMLRVDLQSNLSSTANEGNPLAVWFIPEQRQNFWRNARLRVRPLQDGKRRVFLDSVDAQGKPMQFQVCQYDPYNVPPDKTPPSRSTPAPRPNTGITLEGSRLPLRQVLEQAAKQSGLSIECGLERLRDARLTLSVRGMSPSEFLQGLARTFLIQWQVQGKRATAQETDSIEADRYFLSLGDPDQYRILSRRARDDWQEETDLARSLYDEAGEDLFRPEGVAIAGLSQEAQDGVRREGQENALDVLLRWAPEFVPVLLEDASLYIGHAEAPRGYPAGTKPPPLGPVKPLYAARRLQGTYPEGLSVGLLGHGVPRYVLAGLPEPGAPVAPEPPTDPVARIVAAYTQAQAVREVEYQKMKEGADRQLQQIIDRQQAIGGAGGQP